MIMLETIGYDGLPLYIAKDKIIAMRQKYDDATKTVLYVSCGNVSEEWIINESILSFRYRYDIS